MAASKKPVNQTDAVDAFMDQLDHPLKAEIQTLRALIKALDPAITEHIKWNAPSFGYDGQDRVTFKLYPPTDIQLVFHRGAKVKASADFSFEDPSGLLEWVTADRAVVKFADKQAIETNTPAFIQVVQQWLAATR